MSCDTDPVDPNIYLDGNDKHEAFDLTTPSTTTGEPVAATGLTGLTVHYSLTRSGATIHADVSKSLAEYASTPGRYHATQTGASITARLGSLGGERIYAVIKNGAGTVQANFERFVAAVR